MKIFKQPFQIFSWMSALALILLPLSAKAEVLTTTFAYNVNGGGNMFDVYVLNNPITVRSLDLNLSTATYDLALYVKSGTFVGFNSTPAAWTLIGTVSGVAGNGPGNPTPVDFPDFTLPAGSTNGFYVQATSGDLQVYYSYGTGVGDIAATNSDLVIFQGCSTPPIPSWTLFSTTFLSPRIWNGSVHYDRGITLPLAFIGATNQIIEATGPSGAIATFSVTASNNFQTNVPVTCVPPSGSNFPLGTNTVNCVAVDALGVTNTASFTVTVRDTTPPVLTVPADLVVTANPGECEATVNFFAPTATDTVDSAPFVTCAPPSGSSFPVGRTTVLCTAVDSSGNTNTCSFNVSVYPTQLIPAGETWTQRESNRRWRSITSSADGTKLVAAVFGGQIYTSTDSGASWTPRESNREWTSVASSADGSKLVATEQYGQIYTSTNSGTNWTAAIVPSIFWFSVASSADGSKLVAAPYNGLVYTSTDSGMNWTPRDITREWVSVASSADGTKLVAGVQGGRIYTSTDSGTNWIARESSQIWYSVASSADGSKLVAADLGGQIYTSTDSGVTWTPRESNRTWYSVASSADGTHLAAVDNGLFNTGTGLIYTSSDSGVTWAPCATNREWISVASSADGSKLVAAVEYGQLYTSVAGLIPLTNPPTLLDATNQVVQATAPGTGTTTYDATANHLNGTLVNGPVRIGSTLPLGGYALAFDGGDDYVSVPNAVYFNGNFTIEAWVYPRAYSAWARVLDFFPSQNHVLLTFCDNSGMKPHLRVGGGTFTVPGALRSNEWVHLAATVTGTTGVIYTNGVLAGSGTVDVPVNLVRNSNKIAASNIAGEPNANVILDEIRIWNVARTAPEIQASMNQSLAGTEPGLLAYYRFDEAAAAFSVTATNVCQPNVPVTCTPPASNIPLGTNTVTAVAVDALGQTSTATFTVEVVDARPPIIVTQPVSQEVRPGTNVTFCVTATGAAPLSYQWRKDGTNLVDDSRITGAMNGCLTIGNVVPGDSAAYSVTVTNAYGATNSLEATLWVTALDHFTWSTITSPQAAGTPFPVTLTARDAANNVDTNFTGTVALSGNVVFAADFESGDNGFTYLPDPDATSNLWHRTTHRFASPGNCQYYGLESSTNYNTGTHNAGNLQSPPVSLAGSTAPITLSFNYWLQNEGGSWDQATVEISTDGGVSWSPLVTPLGQAASFINRAVDLSAYAGSTIVLRFNFDTIDDIDNAYEGWYVDDVVVTASTAITPINTGNFVNGVWIGAITVPLPATNMVLLATHSSGYRGSSNPFEVVFTPPPPVFGVYSVPAPGQFRLQATGTAGLMYTLQTSTNLVDWVNHTNVVAGSGGLIECVVNMETNVPACFYRLKWP